jgi:putative ABC transport system permease protein
MFFNYIKMSLRVLSRKKFFTAITLFGISFTIAILMLIVSVLETEVGKTKPLTKKDRIVVLPNLQLKKQFYDTIYVVDTIYRDGEMTLDSTFTVDEAGQNNSNNQFAWSFLNRYLSDVPSAENRTFFNTSSVFNAYVNGTKVEMNAVYADHQFWEIFDFEFVEGFGFGEASVRQEEPVAVITTKLADEYFGRTSKVLNETIEMDGRGFKVVGVVKPAGVSLLTADIIVPHTLLTAVGRGEEIGFGGFMAVYLARPGENLKRIKDDIAFINSGLQVHPSVQEDYNEIVVKPYSYYSVYADRILSLDDDDTEDRSLAVLKWIMIGLISFFILLPTLNLINLNVSRILERSSEIGVRKAFGASQSTILTQFIVENVIQTLVGGVIGIALAVLFISMINDAGLLGDIILKVNFRFFVYSLIICLLFGVLSGVLPAYRMSKIHVVNALKTNAI